MKVSIHHCFLICLTLTIRSLVSLFPHSGQSIPPMFGDYEAQRHWMEIAVNLPISDWYMNTTNNDLNYWGLDYPPLTAYHSFVMGKIAQKINSSWVDLFASRGIESPEHKVFMRYTVLISDILTYIPSVLVFFVFVTPTYLASSTIQPVYCALIALLYPAIILVDHGHFQYNCVSIGLYIFALCAILCDYIISGTVIFCLSLSYKQMELYHSLPLFFYLLGKCFNSSFYKGSRLLFFLSVAVFISFFLVFIPFASDWSQFTQIFNRVFPLSRGLFEDKVSNFWCVSSAFIKWRSYFTHNQLFRLCFLITFLVSLPACIRLLVLPKKIKLLLTEAIVSTSFFLFSYHVHEKSILLPGISALCLLPYFPSLSFHFSIISTFSMWPLFYKDRIGIPVFATLTIYFIIGKYLLREDSHQRESHYSHAFKSKIIYVPYRLLGGHIFQMATYSGFIIIILFSLILSPPSRYPDLFPFLLGAYSLAHFILFLIVWYSLLLFT